MFNRKPQVEYITPRVYKDWRNADHDLEVLGIRMDQARKAMKKSKKPWAKAFWKTTYDRLFNKWCLTLKLKDTGLRQSTEEEDDSERYHWWERSEEIRTFNFGFFDRFYENIGLEHRLAESWARARDEKLQKARQGLA